MKTITPKLTAAQAQVMRWLTGGWEAQPGAGAAIMMNGKRICNVATMQALHRAGFATRDDQGCWRATASGLALRDRIK